MAFMLGSFTNGLFGSARDAFQLVSDWRALRNQGDMRTAALAVRDAAAAGGRAQQGGLPPVTDLGSSQRDSSPPNLDELPAPDFMRTEPTVQRAALEPPKPERKPPVPESSVGQTPAPRTAAPSYLAPSAIPTAPTGQQSSVPVPAPKPPVPAAPAPPPGAALSLPPTLQQAMRPNIPPNLQSNIVPNLQSNFAPAGPSQQQLGQEILRAIFPGR